MKCHSSSRVLARTSLGLVMLALAVTGCSNHQRLTIQGSVSYKGQPVEAGIVKIYGPGDHLEMAYIRDGTFRITDVTPGAIQVTVEPDPSGGKRTTIPTKYADRNTSGLSFTITSATRDLPINLD